MSLKKAAEELLKIADEIDTQAETVTSFVCDKCNHTASLADINARRAEVAKEAGENVKVGKITVNDKIHCPACPGIMSYKASEESEKFYYDPEAKVAQDEEKPAEEKPAEEKPVEEKEEEKKASEPVDYDLLQTLKSA